MTITQNTPEEYPKNDDFSMIEKALVQGDLTKLTPQQRVSYYNKVCESIGLNPYTRPFDYISMNGKLTLYAKKDATEQLRKLNGISIEALEDKVVDDLYIVKATAKDKNGRTDTSTGAVVIGHLKGEAKANAIMKAETKAKRRVTLSISGMGWCDESEIESIPNAKTVEVNHETGDIVIEPTTQSKNQERCNLTQNTISDYVRIYTNQVDELLELQKLVTDKNIDDMWNNISKEYRINCKNTIDIPLQAFQRCKNFLNLCIDVNKKKAEQCAA